MISKLFSESIFRKLRLKNRIVMSPMCQYSADAGHPSSWHQQHLLTRASGGVGLVILEATSVLAEGRISIADLGLWNQEQAESYAKLLTFLKAHTNCAWGIQLAHAGRKASTQIPWKGAGALKSAEGAWKTVGPSPIAFEGYPAPHEMEFQGIQMVKAAFIQSAVWASEAGFEVLEIHAAHGYLLHQFLSPLSNHRQDEWGGSFKNRARLLLEIVEGVRSKIPESTPLFVRISATDWMESSGKPSWTLEESVLLSVELKNRGVDLIDTSSGGLVAEARISATPLYQVPFSEKIRKEAKIATGAVGLITQIAQAEQILQLEQADLVFLGRELLRNPFWPYQAAKLLGAVDQIPQQYLRAF